MPLTVNEVRSIQSRETSLDIEAPSQERSFLFPEPAPEDAGFIDRSLDAGIDLAKGAVGLGQSVVGLAEMLDPTGLLEKGMDAIGYDPDLTNRFLSSLYSEERQLEEEEFTAAEGILDTIKVLLTEPATLLGRALQSAPHMATSVGAARLMASRAALAAGKAAAARGATAGAIKKAAQEAGVKAARIAASSAEGIQQAGGSFEDLGRQGADIGKRYVASIASGLGTALISYAAGSLGLGDVEAGLASRVGKSKVAQKLAGGSQEGLLEELPQSIQEQAWSNYALNKPISEGMSKVATTGTLTGITTGSILARTRDVEEITKEDIVNGDPDVLEEKVSDALEVKTKGEATLKKLAKEAEEAPRIFKDRRPEPIPTLPSNERKRIAALARQRQAKIDKKLGDLVNKAIADRVAGQKTEEETTSIINKIVADKIEAQERLEGVKKRTIGEPSTAKEAAEIFKEEEGLTEAQRVAERRADIKEAVARRDVETIKQLYVTGKVINIGDIAINLSKILPEDQVAVEVSNMTRERGEFLRRKVVEARLAELQQLATERELTSEELQEIGKLRFGEEAKLTPELQQLATERELTSEEVQPPVAEGQKLLAVEDAKAEGAIPDDAEVTATVVTMTPEEFLKLNTRDDKQLERLRAEEPEFTAAGEETIEGQVRFDIEELKASPSPYIVVDKDGRVTGHEGRSRAALVAREGGSTYQVTIISPGPTPELIRAKQRNFSVAVDPGVSEITEAMDTVSLEGAQGAGLGITSEARGALAPPEVTEKPKATTSPTTAGGTITWIQDEKAGGILRGKSPQSDKKFILSKIKGDKWKLIIDKKDLGIFPREEAKEKAEEAIVTEGNEWFQTGKMKDKTFKATWGPFTIIASAPKAVHILKDDKVIRRRLGGNRISKTRGFKYVKEIDPNAPDAIKKGEASTRVEAVKPKEPRKPKVIPEEEKPSEIKAVELSKEEIAELNKRQEAKAKRSKKTFIVGEDGRGYILEDLANLIYEAGMSLRDFANKVRGTLGNAYKAARAKIKGLYEGAKEHFAKITTGGEVGAIGDRVITKEQLEEIAGAEATPEPVPIETIAKEGEKVEPKKVKKKETPEEKVARQNANLTLGDPGTRTERAKKEFKDFFNDAKRLFRGTLAVTSDLLGGISRKYKEQLRRFEFNLSRNIKNQLTAIKPFLEKVRELDPIVRNRLWFTLANPNMNEEAKNIIEGEKLTKEFNKVQEVLDSLGVRADKAGLLISKVKNHFPRHVKDYEGLMQHFAERAKIDDKFKLELEQAQQSADKRGVDISEAEKQELVVKFLSTGRYSNIPNPGSVKLRSVIRVPSDAMQFYSTIEESLINHIFESNEKIGAWETVGKSKIRLALIDALRGKDKEIIAEEKRLKKEGKDSSEELTRLTEEYKTIADNLRDNEAALGSTLSHRLTQDKSLDPGQAEEIARLFKSRFTQVGTRGAVQTMKNIGLAMTLGNPLSAIKQLSDQAFSIYKNDKFALGGLVEAVAKRELVKEFDFDSQLREFSQSSQSKGLDLLLSTVGLKGMDLIGKESFMKASLKKWGNSSIEQFKKEFGESGEVFENVEKVHKAFQNEGKNPDGSFNEEVLYGLYSQLAEFQPINLSETPEFFQTGANLRILWMLKTFSIKAVNAIVRETTEEFKNKNYGKAAWNFISLTGLLSLAGASTDEIKDLILGREKSMRDHVVDNLVQLTLMSRFNLEKGVQQGNLLQSIGGGMLPPTRYLDDVISDTANFLSGDLTFKTMRNVPIGGRILYDRFSQGGRGKELERRRKDILKDIKAGKSGISRRVSEFNRKARRVEGVEVIKREAIWRARRAK